jgi:hypothetical protein
MSEGCLLRELPGLSSELSLMGKVLSEKVQKQTAEDNLNVPAVPGLTCPR